jgi:hypothetical protein
VIEIVGEAMKQVVESISPEVKPVENLPQEVQLPIKDVQLAGEKVNYRTALNPGIFFRYSVFKVRVASPGREWDSRSFHLSPRVAAPETSEIHYAALRS